MPENPQESNDRRLKNLKPWKPGQSGNPKGRPPKSICLTSLLKEEINKINPKDRAKRTWAELIVLATIRLAIKGNATALKEVWDRIDGRVQDRRIDDYKPITIEVVNFDPTNYPEPNEIQLPRR